ncbi:hypothetical protein CEXT_456981 [Caerostris extrusa]|uniref:Uncharacterized protein n=1 Tax=Caerostris extrusa TaxID=172846 RepID=A0AAV4MHT1_CAEEX|nr:hypothetical protein CEXT_456981 [Caerostris extrusa]
MKLTLGLRSSFLVAQCFANLISYWRLAQNLKLCAQLEQQSSAQERENLAPLKVRVGWGPILNMSLWAAAYILLGSGLLLCDLDRTVLLY